MKNGHVTIPYEKTIYAWNPRLAFNSQLNVLEIVGSNDYANTFHQMMSTAGTFSVAPYSLFKGDMNFEVAHSQNVGTLVFSGYGHSGLTKVYIITQNSNWNKIESSDNYLKNFKHPYRHPGVVGNDYWDYGVVEEKNKIYLIGGYTSSLDQNTIQTVDFTQSFPTK